MKQFFYMLLLAGSLAACNDSAENPVEEKIDSLDKREDTLKNNIDSSFDAQIDSLKERKEELKEKFDSTIDAKKDSLKGKKN